LTVDLNSILGIVISVLLAVLTGQVRSVRNTSKEIGVKLDSHILEVTKAMATKVDVLGCRGIRQDCIALNKQVIVDPLDKALEDIEAARREAWERQRSENKSLWLAIRGHGHTEMPNRDGDKVILPANGNL